MLKLTAWVLNKNCSGTGTTTTSYTTNAAHNQKSYHPDDDKYWRPTENIDKKVEIHVYSSMSKMREINHTQVHVIHSLFKMTSVKL